MRSKLLAASPVWKKTSRWTNKVSNLNEILQENINLADVNYRNSIHLPHEYFAQYFTDTIFELGARQTNVHSMETNGVPLSPPVTPEELKMFFGICAVVGTHIQVSKTTIILVTKIWPM